VVRHPAAVTRALVIFDSSDFLTDILVRHPEEISSLEQWDETPSRLGMGQLFESVLGPVPASNDPVVKYLTASELSYGERLALLRRHYRHRAFTSGARDLAEFRNVYRSLNASTAAAEDAIAAAYGIAGSPEGLAVLGLGRLGAGEFDILSDADLLFVCDHDDHREEMSKSAANLMQALSAYTQDGMVFPVDARLRPQGGDGELVFTPAHLAAYCEHEAQPWEALTYTKLRFLGGSRSLGDLALSKTKVLFERFSADQGFLAAVREMRTRLEPEEKDYSFKTSPGAIYDIDFISGFLLVKHGIREKGGTLRDRLWRCAGEEVLDRADAATLDHAAEFLRTVDHIVRLVVGRAHKWLPATEHARQVAESLTGEILKRQFTDGLEAELLGTLREVREVYERVLKD
jgi:glutamate-ammonia-ligase adenylyltransferase